MARKISAVGQVLKDYYGLSDSFFETPIPEKVETTMIASMTSPLTVYLATTYGLGPKWRPFYVQPIANGLIVSISDQVQDIEEIGCPVSSLDETSTIPNDYETRQYFIDFETWQTLLQGKPIKGI